MKMLLLCAFSTVREGTRVRFPANSVVDLTDEELADLDNLTVKTGRLHFRDPVNEGGAAIVASEGDVATDVPDFIGQNVALDKKTVPMLQAYLDFHDVKFETDANKAALASAVKAHELGKVAKAADPDGGL